MPKKKVKKSVNPFSHIHELPQKYFPRKSKAQAYRSELLRMMSDLRFTNEKVQYSSQICSFNIRSIPHKGGFTPSQVEVFRQISNFVYHYENFCFRAFAFREKLLQLLNEIFQLNFEERDVRFKYIKNNRTIIDAKLSSLLEKFYKKKIFGKIIEERHSMTHKLYYGKTFDHFLRPTIPASPMSDPEFKKWCNSWNKEIRTRSKMTDKVTHQAYDMNHEITRKIVAYKDKLKKRKV